MASALMPLDLSPERTDPLADSRALRWVWAFMLLGVAARLARYLLRFPLWEDECFLAANYLDRGYLELLKGLDFGQVCPFLFLWVQLTLVKLFGFNEYILRLFPCACSLASLVLFRHLAGRLLRGTPLVIAVAIFAVSYPGVRYASEAKQYASDLFVALVLLSLAVAWWQRPGQNRWLWAMAALVPLCVGLSYPAVFVGGGVSLFVAWVLWRSRDRRGWAPWAVYNLLLVGSFAGLFALSAAQQSQQTLEFMQGCWRDGFPPLAEPLKFLRWLIVVHTSDLLAYPLGGHNGGSVLTFLCCAAAVVLLVRRRQARLLLLCLAPLALSFIAAALHRYPYGQMVKFQIYLAPAFCMLAGLGAAMLLIRKTQSPSGQPIPLFVVLTLLAAIGVGIIGRDVFVQTKTQYVMRSRDFARWFWYTAEFDGEVACLKTDLGLAFSERTYRAGMSAVYLCNQRIYSLRHARGEPPRMDRIAADRPLRCIEYRSTTQDSDYSPQARDAWLQSMQTQYDLVAEERYPFTMANWDEPPHEVDYLLVYKFLPKGVRTAQQPNGQSR